MSLTMTPAKYTEVRPYMMAKMLASVSWAKQMYRPAHNPQQDNEDRGGGGGGRTDGKNQVKKCSKPAGKRKARMWRSKKKEDQVVGWCSDTEAMMGMCSFAYVGSSRV